MTNEHPLLALARFGEKCLDAHREELADLGGDWLQEAAVECGLLKEVEVTEACDPENCRCAEYGDFPQTCYKLTEKAYLIEPPPSEPCEQPVATPGATDCGEDSVSLSAESSRPRELLSPFDSAAILAAPRERRISMSFETQEQYEAALVFLDMADQDTPPGQRWVERSPEESDRMLAAAFKQGASRDASQGPNAWADAKGGLPDNKL